MGMGRFGPLSGHFVERALYDLQPGRLMGLRPATRPYRLHMRRERLHEWSEHVRESGSCPEIQ